MAIEDLRAYLANEPTGEVKDHDRIVKLLQSCWDDLGPQQFGRDGLLPSQLSRMTGVKWNPPELTFVFQRQPHTGSIKAPLQHWKVNIEDQSVDLQQNRYTYVEERQAPVRESEMVEILNEVVQALKANASHEYVKWRIPGVEAKILVTEIYPPDSAVKQTRRGRILRFRKLRDDRLTAMGFEKVSGENDVFRKLAHRQMVDTME